MLNTSRLKEERSLELESIMDKNGIMKIMPTTYFRQFTLGQILTFMHNFGIYSIPTVELINFLRNQIGNDSAIEIGAGNGAYGRALNIPMTDSHQQADPKWKAFYDLVGTPTIKYPSDVEKLNYSEAINKYKPKVVIGSYITHKFNPKTQTGNPVGVDELDLMSRVDKYIHVGNEKVHGHSALIDLPKTTFKSEAIITRSNQGLQYGRVWIWEKADVINSLQSTIRELNSKF